MAEVVVNRQEMIDLVTQYFSAVDREDFGAISATMAEDCVFTVETHGIRLQGTDEIRRMFQRLWDNHAAVKHQDFVFVAAPDDGRIAARFLVINTQHGGSLTHKSNCNFFEVRDQRFSHIAVYMAGENTLDST